MILKEYKIHLVLLIVTIISFFTYFRGYSEPPYFYWDENYHVASAQKYINHTFFMEPHPPLGKLLIALGEIIVGANQKNDQFLGTDHAPTTPEKFLFAGYRLFPVLFAWLTAPLLAFTLFRITNKPILALIFSIPYLFENSLIVHNRGAMLEGTQLFFIVASILFFVELWIKRKYDLILTCAFAISFGLATAVKINALVLSLLPLIIVLRYKSNYLNIIKYLAITASLFCITYFVPWYIHFNLATHINSELNNQGYYLASEKYKEVLRNNETASLYNFPTMLRDSLRFVPHYTKGVPSLNYCKSDENGSYPLTWPVGGGSINYRWERHGDLVQYLYLQVNPIAWWIAFLGIIGSTLLLGAKLLFWDNITIKHRELILVFWILYLFYMCSVLSVDRVFYLYHYFIPLMLSYLLLALFADNITNIGPIKVTTHQLTIAASSMTIAIICAFWYYSPLTYYLPILNSGVTQRSWISLWDLRCQSCPRIFPIARPLGQNDQKVNTKPEWSVNIGGLKSLKVTQEWGEPHQGQSVEGLEVVVNGKLYQDVIGTHAYSKIEFDLQRMYLNLSGGVALPNYLPKDQGSVIFEILGDGRSLWRSQTTKRGLDVQNFLVNVKDVKSLALVATDAGDGNSYDHATWISLKLSK